MHNIPTTTSSCYSVGVRAQRLTQKNACICAGKRVHELACTRWGPGVWTPAKTQRKSIRSQQQVEVSCGKRHPRAHDTQTPRAGVGKGGGDENANHMRTLPYRCLSWPSASVPIASSRMPLSMQTHAHVHTHSLFMLMFSFCHTQLARDTGGSNPGPVSCCFSERTCSCSGGQAASPAPCLLVFITLG